MEYFIENPANGIMEEVTDPRAIPIARQYMIVTAILSIAVWVFVLWAVISQLRRANWVVFFLAIFIFWFWVFKWYRGTNENGKSINVSWIDEYYLNKIKKASNEQ